MTCRKSLTNLSHNAVSSTPRHERVSNSQLILDCYEVFVKYVGSSETSLPWSQVQFLPDGAIHILKGTYGHCKVKYL
jgi:hypothetical protein